jgi:hypothetical protein
MSTPHVTGLIDSGLGDWRAQVVGLVNPVTTAIYSVIPIGSLWFYTKAINSGPNSTTIFVGPWPDSPTATSMMNTAKHIDGFA